MIGTIHCSKSDGLRTRAAASIAKAGRQKNGAGKLCERIRDFASGHSLLPVNERQGVDTADLVERQLAQSHQRIGSRVLLEGAPVRLRPFAAQCLGLALQELVLNAGEYGALSEDHGTVHIAWKTVNECNKSLFTITWSESGGPLVKAPACTGFGHRVLCEMTRYHLEADTRLDYRPGGLIWQLTAPAECVLD